MKSKPRNTKNTKQATLVFLLREDQVLLAMKKRGFGQGWWNGMGGKFDPKLDKKMSETAKREVFEEIRVNPKHLKKVALLHFYFADPSMKKNNQDVHVFTTDKWDGTPKETEEMRPKWFGRDKIPFDLMWSDDGLWLPRVLLGEKIEAWFEFDKRNNLSDWKISRK